MSGPPGGPSAAAGGPARRGTSSKADSRKPSRALHPTLSRPLPSRGVPTASRPIRHGPGCTRIRPTRTCGPARRCPPAAQDPALPSHPRVRSPAAPSVRRPANSPPPTALAAAPRGRARQSALTAARRPG